MGNDDHKPSETPSMASLLAASNDFHPNMSQREGRKSLLKDHDLIDGLSRFNHEKIPERAVHARGAGAHGEFEVTHDISDICNIDMLLGVGKKTSCIVRFSTTGLERGSAESTRDAKGMAVKFFTAQGNWDWVCLNIPIFFIRDPSKFPGMMHAQRRDPKTNFANPNTWWDWVCNNPESLHMVLWLYSEFGAMFNYQNLSGYVGHAYKWVMPDGSWKYVHFFLSSDRGPNFEQGFMAENASPTDPDSATKDLHEAIEQGNYPTWTANVQVVDPKDVHKLAFNILDITKHWNLGNYPRDIDVIPSRPFGKLTLNRNTQSYFDEIEQLAFSPSHLVPGVEPSEDPMLQARMFAYPDAQRYRLGVNNQQLPINQPKCTGNHPLRGDQNTFKSAKEIGPEFDAWVSKASSDSWLQTNELDYKFPREFWQVLPTLRSPEFQNSIVENISLSLAQAEQGIRDKVCSTLGLVAADLADRVRECTDKIIRERSARSQSEQRSSKL